MSTLQTILLFAAEAGEEKHTPIGFYVTGGVLAVWAILVSAIGIKKHDFPSSGGTANAVMGISALLVVAAMATSALQI
jgi:hypothetical protein